MCILTVFIGVCIAVTSIAIGTRIIMFRKWPAPAFLANKYINMGNSKYYFVKTPQYILHYITGHRIFSLGSISLQASSTPSATEKLPSGRDIQLLEGGYALERQRSHKERLRTRNRHTKVLLGRIWTLPKHPRFLRRSSKHMDIAKHGYAISVLRTSLVHLLTSIGQGVSWIIAFFKNMLYVCIGILV